MAQTPDTVRVEVEGTWTREDLALALVGLPEIARRLGTTTGTVRSWRNRHADFPAPVVDLAMGPVWVWSDVFAWSEARKAKREQTIANISASAGERAEFDVLG